MSNFFGSAEILGIICFFVGWFILFFGLNKAIKGNPFQVTIGGGVIGFGILCQIPLIRHNIILLCLFIIALFLAMSFSSALDAFRLQRASRKAVSTNPQPN